MNDSLPVTPLILSIIHTSQTPKGIITTSPSASQGRWGMAAWTVQTLTTETRVSWRTLPKTTWCCPRRTCPTFSPTRAPLAPPITIRTSTFHWKPRCLPLPRLMWLFLHLSTSTHRTIKVLFMCEHELGTITCIINVFISFRNRKTYCYYDIYFKGNLLPFILSHLNFRYSTEINPPQNCMMFIYFIFIYQYMCIYF